MSEEVVTSVEAEKKKEVDALVLADSPLPPKNEFETCDAKNKLDLTLGGTEI